MYAYINAFLSGSVAPFWPHAILIGLSVLASVSVGIGIILESPKWGLATALIVIGVTIEAICTISLFGFDEGISNAQQDKIAALEGQLAPRDFKDTEVKRIIDRLTPFKGRSVLIQSYVGDTEGHRLLFIMSQILALAKVKPELGYWNPGPPPGMDFLLGVEIDAPPEQTDLADALEEALSGTNVGVRPKWFSMPPGTPVTVHIGVKPSSFAPINAPPKIGEP